MKIGDLLKKKKPAEPARGMPIRRPLQPPRPVGGSFGRTSPVSALAERIGSLSRQGMAEPEIVKELRSEGYSSIEIDKGLRDSLKSSVGEAVLPVMERPVRETRPQPRIEEREDLRMPEPPLPPRPGARQVEERQRPFPVIDLRKGIGSTRATEELIEVTVEEKWREAETKIKGVEGTIIDLGARLKKLEEDVEELNKAEQRKESEISTKIDTYKDSMVELSERMEGMESALKSALESVLESNRTLSESMRSLKDKGR